MKTKTLPGIITSVVVVLTWATMCYGGSGAEMRIASADLQAKIYTKVWAGATESAFAIEQPSAPLAVAEGKTIDQDANVSGWQLRLEVASGGGQVGRSYAGKAASDSTMQLMSESGGGQIG